MPALTAWTIATVASYDIYSRDEWITCILSTAPAVSQSLSLSSSLLYAIVIIIITIIIYYYVPVLSGLELLFWQ